MPDESNRDRPGFLARLFRRASAQTSRTPRLLETNTASGVIPDSGVLMAELPYDRGQDVGWLDSNIKFTPEYLHGTSTAPGKLLEIRRTDDVIAPAVDSRREMLADFDYDVEPRRRFKDDPIAKQAAIQVGARLNSMPDRSLSFWVAETYDYWFTSGLCLYDITLDELDRIRLHHVRPGLIRRFEQDETGFGFERVYVQARNYGDRPIPARKLAYFSRNAYPGEFWGESGLRCMIATSETTLQLYSALLQAIRYSMGFPYIADTGNGIASDGDKLNAMKAMSKLMRGESDIAFFGKQLEPKMLASQVPALQQFGPLAQHQAERKQAAARNALNNLGMRGVGSRSLGEVVQDADQKAVRAHLNLFMRVLSGDSHANGTFMQTLTELEGFDPVYTPELRIAWTDGAERKSREHIQTVADLMERGILERTPAAEDWIREQLQVPADE